MFFCFGGSSSSPPPAAAAPPKDTPAAAGTDLKQRYQSARVGMFEPNGTLPPLSSAGNYTAAQRGTNLLGTAP